ncbi:MAG: 6-carboxytetrahydropterin synthase QueD [Planctomycetota bacterium]
MYELSVEREFAAAHRLKGYQGPCENLHGHNWKVGVKVESESLNDFGMVMDFKDLKALVQEAVDALDHKYLNEVPPFDRENPTTENLARHLCEGLSARLPPGIRLARVEVWESSRAGAAYVPEE